MDEFKQPEEGKNQPASLRSYGTEMIRGQLVTMLSHLEGVRDGKDIEALHDMRVASRRLRAALGVFAAAFEDPDFARFEAEVKAITDALGEARDLDVMIETLEGLEREIPESQRSGMDRFIQETRARRRALQSGVVRALDRVRKQALDQWFERIVERDRLASLPIVVEAEPAPEEAPIAVVEVPA